VATRRERVVLELDDQFTGGMLRAAAAAKLAQGEIEGVGRSQTRTSSSSDRGTQSFTRQAKSLNDLEARARGAERAGSLLGDTLTATWTAALPIGALAVPAVAGLATQLGFAAGAAGTALLAFNGVGNALKALDAAQLDPSAANLQKLNEVMGKLGPSGREFVQELDRLEPKLKSLKRAAEDGLLPGVTDGIDSLLTRLPQVRRIITEISQASGELASEAGAGLAGPGFDSFFRYLETDAKPILLDLGRTLGTFAEGIGHLFVGFAPEEQAFSTFLLNAAKGFNSWAEGLERADGASDIMKYLSENGPKVADALGSIAHAIVSVAQAGAPLSGPTLQALTALAQIIDKIASSPLGTPLVTLAAGLALVNRALATRDVARTSPIFRLLSGDSSGINSSRAAVRSLTADLRTMQRTALQAQAATEGGAAAGLIAEDRGGAKGRLQSRAATLAKGTAAVAGLALVTSDLADKTGLANTASYALLGTLAGPWGAAIGGGIGLVKDLAAANDDLANSIKLSNAQIESGTVTQLTATRASIASQVARNKAALNSSNPFDRPKAALNDIFGTTAAAKQQLKIIDDAIAEINGEASGSIAGVGSLLTEGLGGALGDVGRDFDSATAASKEFFDSLNGANAALNLRSALRQQAQAIIDFRKVLKENPEKPGRQDNINRNAALDAYAQSSLNVVSQTDPSKQAAALAAARKQFVALAQSMGDSKQKAQALADAFGLIDRTAEGAGKKGKRAGQQAATGLDQTTTSAEGALTAVNNFNDLFSGLTGKKAKPKVDVQAGQSLTLLQQVQNLLNGLHDKTITVRVRNKSGGEAPGGGAANQPGTRTGGRSRGGGGQPGIEQMSLQELIATYGGPFPVAQSDSDTTASLTADYLSNLQSQMDIQSQLNAKIKKGKKKGQFQVQGLDRQALYAQLAALKEAAQQASQTAGVVDQAAQDLQDAVTNTSDSLFGSFDLFSRGTSASGAERYAQQFEQDVAAYSSALQMLASAGAGAGVLRNVERVAESGDYKSAAKLARNLANNPAALGNINSAISQAQAIQSGIASIVNGSAFAATNAGVQGGVSVSVPISPDADPNQWLADLRRTVQFTVQQVLAGQAA
jgi:hypothetical protein